MELKTIFANLNKTIPGKEISYSLSPNPAKKNTGALPYKYKTPTPPLRANVNNVNSSINQLKNLRGADDTSDSNIYNRRISFPSPNGVKKLNDVIGVISKNKYATNEKIIEEIKQVIGKNSKTVNCITPKENTTSNSPDSNGKYKNVIGDVSKVSNSLNTNKEDAGFASFAGRSNSSASSDKIIYTKQNENKTISSFNELTGVQDINKDINILPARKVKNNNKVYNILSNSKDVVKDVDPTIVSPKNSNKENSGTSVIQQQNKFNYDEVDEVTPIPPLVRDEKNDTEEEPAVLPNGDISSVSLALSNSEKDKISDISDKVNLPNNINKVNNSLLIGDDSIPNSYNKIPASLITEYTMGISAITKDKTPDTYGVSPAKKPTNIEELDKVDPSIRYLKENNYNYADNNPVLPKNISDNSSTISLLTGKTRVDNINAYYAVPANSTDPTKKIVQALSDQGKNISEKEQESGEFSAFELKSGNSNSTDIVKNVLEAVGDSAQNAINFTEESIGALADSYSPASLLNSATDAVKTLSSSMINGSVSFVSSAANLLLSKAASYAKTWLASQVGIGGVKKNFSRAWANDNNITNVLGFGVKFSLTNWYESEGKDGPELWNMNASMPLGDLKPVRTFASQLSSSNTTKIYGTGRDSTSSESIGTSKIEVLSVGGYSEALKTSDYAGRYLWRLSDDIATVDNVVSMGKYDNNIGYQYGPHFKGYSDIANFEARVDRFYDFAIIAPPQLVKTGLPQAFSRPGLYINTTIKWNDNNSGTPIQYFKNDGKGIKRNRENIDIQANLNTINTIKTSGGESYPLGYFGSEIITKHLDMIANINMTLVEDTSLSVRKWLEAYQNYMYNYNACSDYASTDYYNNKVDSYDNNINPLMHRPIYQGYYYIKFWYLNSMHMPLFSKIFYGVPNYDLNVTPESSNFKTFMIDWDIIGDTPIMYSNLWTLNEGQQPLTSSESEDGADDVPATT